MVIGRRVVRGKLPGLTDCALGYAAQSHPRHRINDMMRQMTTVLGPMTRQSFPIEPAAIVPEGGQVHFVRRDVFVIATDQEVAVYKLDGDTFHRVGSVPLASSAPQPDPEHD